MDSFSNLQYIFACISTHSKWVKIIAADPKALSDHFELTADNNELVKSFLKANSEKLWISAILMEERRWREILPAIKFTYKLVGSKLLKQCWAEYLNNFALNQRIPKSPILESKEFLTFLLAKDFESTWKEIFEYEVLKNTIYSVELNGESHMLPLKDLNQLIATLNPSFTSKVFSYSISKVIQILEEESLPLNEETAKAEHIGFYKTITGKVKTIRLNSITNNLLLSLNKPKVISDWICSTKLNKATALKFLEKMVSQSLISTTEAK